MDIIKADKIYLLDTRIKQTQVMINCYGTDEDFGVPIEDLENQMRALTNALKML